MTEPSFKHPVLENQVYGTLDICHMLKLARNALAELGIFINSDGSEISWEFINRLQTLQDKVRLKFGNNLTSLHTSFQMSKMKVKLAAQVFSTSVADALTYLRNSEAPGFQGCTATIDFI